MFTDDLFHPDHVIKTPEFKSAVMESSYGLISHMTMEMLTIPGKILVLFNGITYAGIEIRDLCLLK